MKRYRRCATAGMAITMMGVLAGCGTSGGTTSGSAPASNATNEVSNLTNNTSGVTPSNSSLPSNSAATNNATTNASTPKSKTVQGNVLTLYATLSDRNPLPSVQQGSPPVNELRSTYGTIQASSSKKTTNPLQIILTDHGTKDVLYADNSKSLKWLELWQLSGNYLLLNIGMPAPNQMTGDFSGDAVVIDLKTRKVVLKQLIGVESQTQAYITPTALVSLWFIPGGPSYSTDDFYTNITDLGTGKSVAIKSSTSYPFGRDPYVLGNRVYFASGHKTYYIELPAAAWRTVSSKPYQLVLRPSLKITS